ncbi:MAG: hypothetical protein Q9181_007097 [Wetmoreana brouardii]
MEILRILPTAEQFTPLANHQSQTPPSFYSGPPVLHQHSPSTTILLNSKDLASSPALATLLPLSQHQRQSNGSAHASSADEIDDDSGHDIRTEDIDVWVTSDAHDSKFLLFNTELSAGVSIPYPSISLHAIQRTPSPSLLLQILTGAGPQFDDHDPEGTNPNSKPSSPPSPPAQTSTLTPPLNPISIFPTPNIPTPTTILIQMTQMRYTRKLMDCRRQCRGAGAGSRRRM